MICPECETEYREGFTRCSDCGVALVRDLSEAASEPGSALTLLTVETWPDSIATLLEVLENEEVPYVIEAGTALPLYDGEEETLTSPRPWKARVFVTAESAELARTILAAMKAELKRQESH